MLSNELEYCLNDAFQRARDERHEFITVEHLLLALLDTPPVVEILKACGADLVRLRRELKEFIDASTPRLRGEEDDESADVQPTLGFQRVLQRRKLSNDISLKEIHFAPASPVDRNCKRVTVCRRENGKTVCRTETQCD